MPSYRFKNPFFVNRDIFFNGVEKLLDPATPQTGMLIYGEEGMGKSWLLAELRDQSNIVASDSLTTPRLRGAAITTVHVDFENSQDDQNLLMLIRLLRNRIDHPQFFTQLNETINKYVDQTDAGGLRILRDRILQAFNLIEFGQFTQLSLNLSLDNIAGATLRDKVFELIMEMRREGRLLELLRELGRDRPHLIWEFGRQLVSTNEIENQHAKQAISQSFFDNLSLMLQEAGTIVFLFDGFEHAPQRVRAWLSEAFIGWLHKPEAAGAIVIISQRWQATSADDKPPGFGNLLPRRKLQLLRPAFVREYLLERRKLTISEEKLAQYMDNHRKPQLLAALAERLEAEQQINTDDDFWDDLE